MNKALLIGINAYPTAPLEWCVHDLDVMQPYVQSLPYGEWAITRLVDGQATAAAIDAALVGLVRVAVPGDRLLFHYSGHGAYDPYGEHPLICPVDFDWTAAHWITGGQIVAILATLAPGVRLAWISDSCHSGRLEDDRGMVLDNTRSQGPGAKYKKIKTFPRPHWVQLSHAYARDLGIRPRGFINGELDCGFVAGCQAGGTSADNGLTPHLVEALKESPLDTPLSRVVETTARLLANDGYDQVPEVDGADRDKPLWAG
jgi:hypothetical protein